MRPNPQKTSRKGAIFALGLLLFSQWAIAVKLLEVKQQEHAELWSFTPQFELAVSQKVREAINNGITVTFVVQIQLLKENAWWFDDLVARQAKTFEVTYFSLSRQYQLLYKKDKQKHNFVNLDQLLLHLSQETEFSFARPGNFDLLRTRLFLDKQALPSTMQLPTVFDQDWNIQSDWNSTKPDRGN